MQHQFNDSWLSETFGLMTALNGFVAVAAGVIAGLLADTFGYVSPFMMSLVLLIIGAWCVCVCAA